MHRLLSVLILLGAASTVSSQRDSSVLKSEGPPTFFLKDTSDDLCLAGDVFKRCGLDTLWFVTGKAGAYQLHRRPEIEEDGDICLAK